MSGLSTDGIYNPTGATQADPEKNQARRIPKVREDGTPYTLVLPPYGYGEVWTGGGSR